MSVAKIPQNLAMSEGSKLWIIENDVNNFWWKKLDVRSGFLLSRNFLTEKTSFSDELKNILTETNLNFTQKKYPDDYCLMGTENHFLNKWLLLWNKQADSKTLHMIEKICTDLNINSVRFFSAPELATQLNARPSASSLNISCLENI